jgi:[DsrC]-trisulfide reductase subunit M
LERASSEEARSFKKALFKYFLPIAKTQNYKPVQPSPPLKRERQKNEEAFVETVYYIILIPMVYVAFGIFFIGTGVRLIKIFLEPKNPTALAIFPEKRPRWLWAVGDTFLLPTVRRHKPVLWVVLMFYHISFLLLIIGHLELIEDFKVIQIIPHEIFLGNGFIGLILSLTLLYLLFRRFLSPVKELSVPEDYYLLILLFLTVIFGSQLDWARAWYGYGEMGVDEYRNYLSSLLYLRPELSEDISLTGHSFMLVLHVFFANLFLIFFPFSKIMHSFFSMAMNKLRRG